MVAALLFRIHSFIHSFPHSLTRKIADPRPVYRSYRIEQTESGRPGSSKSSHLISFVTAKRKTVTCRREKDIHPHASLQCIRA